MTPADRTAVDEHLRELETILRHIELAARTPGNGTQRPYRLADARADADRGLAALGRARHMLLGTAAYLGTPGVPVVQPWEIKVHCSKGERTLRAGVRWTDSLHGGTWEVVEPSGKRIYSPSGLGGTPEFWCKHVSGPNTYRDYARDDGCVEFCGDSIAAQLVAAGVTPPVEVQQRENDRFAFEQALYAWRESRAVTGAEFHAVMALYDALAARVDVPADTRRLDWLHSWNDVLLETWFEGGRIVHRVSRHGHVVGTGSTLREAIDAAYGVPASVAPSLAWMVPAMREMAKDLPNNKADALLKWASAIERAHGVKEVDRG